MKHKIRALLLLIIFNLSFLTKVVSAATYYVASPNEEIIAFNKAMATNDSEFTLDYNPEEKDYIVDLLGYEYSLQDYTDSDYAYYNISKMAWKTSTKKSGSNVLSYKVEYSLDEMETPKQTDYVYYTVRKLIKDNPSIIKASNYDKVVWAYDYIVNHFTYDNDYSNYTAYELLTEGKAVCQGFVKLFYVMAIELGLDCKIVSGDNHAWNLVELEGKWYYVDTTWGACGWGREYLLRAKRNMKDHTLDPVYENYFNFATADYIDIGNSGYRGILASVYNVQFDPLKKNKLKTGETFDWMLDNPDNVRLSFTSDNTKVATVSDSGKIKGIATGSTVIRAKNEELGIEQICIISINKEETVVVGYNKISVRYNRTAGITLEVSPSNAILNNVSYRSKNKYIATVDNRGKITGVRAGTTTIEVSYGNNQKIEVPVTVKPAVNNNFRNITVPTEKTVSIIKAVEVSANGYKDLTYKTSNSRIAKVSSAGSVTGVKKGNCSVKIYDKGSKQLVATLNVTVK